MKVFEYLDRIDKMHKLVQRRRTGTPAEFAQQLGVSRTSLYELIDELRSRGAPIAYSKSTRTFFYSQPYEIFISCSLRPLSCKEEKEKSGGIKLFSTVLFFRTLCSELSIHSLPC
jgi:predicted DNA-binding transcriptional regulator YafY